MVFEKTSLCGTHHYFITERTEVFLRSQAWEYQSKDSTLSNKKFLEADLLLELEIDRGALYLIIDTF